MKGQFDLTLFNVGRHKDADFERAIAAGKLDHLLLDCQVAQRAVGSNMLFDNLAAFLFYRLFGGAPDPGVPWSSWHSAGPCIVMIQLNTRTNAPTYQEQDSNGYYDNYQYFAYYASSSGSKKLIADSVAWSIWCDPDKEQIFFRTRVLYLPSQGVSNNITSLGVWFCSRADGGLEYGEKSSIGRFRLKDGAGEPIRMNKTAYQALLIEYTFSMLSL